MKITEIEVDRFRIWRNLTLPLESDGLSVFYGPNEAGKTTLMRFVRAVLYGFSPEDVAARGPDGRVVPWHGSITCRHRKRRFVIDRRAERETRGIVTVTGFRKKAPADRQLAKLLKRTSEEVFRDIFAIGVKELQQLATMESSEVANRIYGLTLGHEGQALLTAMSDVRESRTALLDTKENRGQLPALFTNYEDVVSKGDRFDESRENHAVLCRDRDALTARVEELRRRQQVIESNLTGYRHLQRCWSPWSRIRSIQAELSALPVVAAVSDELFEEIDGLDEKIKTAVRKRDQTQAALEELQKQARQGDANAALRQHAGAIRSLVEQSDWLTDIEDRIRKSGEAEQTLRHELDQAVVKLGGDWTPQKLAAIDTSPTAHSRLLKQARRYSAAMSRRGKLRRLNRSISKSTQKQLVELDEQLKALGGTSIDESIAGERARLADLEDLAQLRLQASELRQRSATIRRLVDRIDATGAVPEWIDRIFRVFGVVGSLLFVVALLVFIAGDRGVSALHAALAAAAFGAAGLTWWFFRLGLKNHFDNQAGLRLDDMHDEARQTEAQLAAVNSRLTALMAENAHLRSAQEIDGPAREVDMIRETVHRIAELERLGRVQARVNERRERLGRLRNRFRTAQQKVMQERQEWAGLLRELGMEETVKVSEAFELWERIQEVNEVQQRLRKARPETEALRRLYKSMSGHIRDIGVELETAGLDYDRPLTILSGWREELKTLHRDEEAAQRADEGLRLKQRTADEAGQVLDRLRANRAGLLAQAGVSSVEELRRQQEWIELRQDHEARLETARAELDEVVRARPNIALVENDLVAYDEEQTSDAIEMAELELEEVNEELGSARERLGSIRKEIEALETSRNSLSARFERGQVAGRIHRTAEEWFALQIADQLIDTIRQDFEKSNVSGTLAIASEYLEQLTQGRYIRVWAPLGKQRICVDDRLGRTFRIEQLSGGTREQLFLAIRFALVAEFSQRGIELPMVMDDLFVNFDEGRTSAAVDALLHFANSGQQVLFFTCHRHLAEMFQARGVSPVWLPGPAAAEVEDVAEPDDDDFYYANEDDELIADDDDDLADEIPLPEDDYPAQRVAG